MNTLKYILVIAAGVLLACAAVSTLVSVSQEYSYQKRQVCCTDHRLIYEKLCEINSNLVELVNKKQNEIRFPQLDWHDIDPGIYIETNWPGTGPEPVPLYMGRTCLCKGLITPEHAVIKEVKYGSAASH